MAYAAPHPLWNCHPSPLALSQVRADRDILIVYNTSSQEKKKEVVKHCLDNSPPVLSFLKQETLHQALKHKNV